MKSSFEKICNEKYDLVGQAYLVLDVLCFAFFEAETFQLIKSKTSSDTAKNSASFCNRKKL
jgi:hypothetical protein